MHTPLARAAVAAPSPPPATTRRRHPRALKPIALALLLSACGADGPGHASGGGGSDPASGVAFPVELPPVSTGVLGVTDVLRVPGGWWLLDGRSSRLLRVGPDFQLLRSLGGRGEAPGEFASPRGLLQSGDSIVVIDIGAFPVLHVHDAEGRFVRRHVVRTPECASFRLWSAEPDPSGGYLLGGTCLRAGASPAMGAAVVRFQEGSPGVLVASELRPAGPGRINPDAAFLVELEGRAWMGRSFDNCFHPLDDPSPSSISATGDHHRLCLEPWERVPFPIDEVAGAISSPGRAALIPSVFGGIEHLPLMDGLFPHPAGILVRRLSGLESRDLVLVGLDGTTRTLMTGLPERSWVVGDSVLVAWDGAEGSHIEMRPLPPR